MKKTILLTLIVLLGGALRFWDLSAFPVQLDHDEVSQLYDTRSIVETGKDIYGNVLPLAFTSTGDYKVGHYIYISTIFYRIFGMREITIRLPAAFFGSLTVLAVFLFILELSGNWWMAFASALMIAITPSEIFYSRKSFENVIGVNLDFWGLYFLVKSLKSKTRLWLLLGGLALALAMYIYTAQTIIIPLLIIFFVLLYKNSKLTKRDIVWLFLTMTILIMPLVYITATNAGIRFRANSVFITQDPNLGGLINLTHNTVKSYLDFITTRYLNQFNPIYLFANGLDLTDQGLIGSGPLLLIQLPFLVLGLLFLLRSKELNKASQLLIGIVAIAMVPSAITFEKVSPHRAMLVFAVMSIISGFGLYWFYNYLQKVRPYISWIMLFATIVAILLNLVYFVFIYTVGYPFEKSHKLQYPFKQVSQYILSQYPNFTQIVWDPKYGDVAPIVGVGAHYYLAYYGNYSPAKFQKEYHTDSRGQYFDKFAIRNVIWGGDKDLKNTLLIVSPWSVPVNEVDQSLIIKKFYFYNGQLAFYAIKL